MEEKKNDVRYEAPEVEIEKLEPVHNAQSWNPGKGNKDHPGKGGDKHGGNEGGSHRGW